MGRPPPLLRRPDRIFDGYVFDLDGTLYLGDQPLPGAARLLDALRELGRTILFVSNNPTRTPVEYVEKLGRLGVQASEGEVINTVLTTVEWVRREHPDARVFAIAEEPLLDALRAAGVRLCEDPGEIDVVIASFDRALNYRKLQIAFDALWRRRDTRLLATNIDRYCPTPEGGQPDTGALVAALETCTGRRCEEHFGKPGRVMGEAITRRLQLPSADCVVVGDRLYTDLAAAKRGGMAGAVVITGETEPADLASLDESEQPEFVLARVDQLLPDTEWERRGWLE